MTVFGYIGGGAAPQELAAAGAHTFRDMAELPRLLRRAAAPDPPPLLDTTGSDR